MVKKEKKKSLKGWETKEQLAKGMKPKKVTPAAINMQIGSSTWCSDNGIPTFDVEKYPEYFNKKGATQVYSPSFKKLYLAKRAENKEAPRKAKAGKSKGSKKTASKRSPVSRKSSNGNSSLSLYIAKAKLAVLRTYFTDEQIKDAVVRQLQG